MTDVVEIQNRINIRNLVIFFILGIIGIANGIRDFSIYKLGISKMLFPDPATFHNVVELNNSQISLSLVNSSMSFGGIIVLIIFMLIAVMVIGASAGVMGMGE